MSPPMSIPMAAGCEADSPIVGRHLRSFKREGVEIMRTDWVMATTLGLAIVGRVSEIAQLHVCVNGHITAVVRVLLEHVVSPVFDSLDLVCCNCQSREQWGAIHLLVV